jgi:hypothetical protein
MHPHHLSRVIVSAVSLVFAVGVFTPAAAQSVSPDTAEVALQSTSVTPDGRLTFAANGFAPSESTAITVEDGEGSVQARLAPSTVESDGRINMMSVAVPDGLTPGPHTLRITGQSSGRFGHAAFVLQWQPPTVRLEGYTGKPTHTFSISGTGFVPGEQVDVYLGAQTTAPMLTLAADNQGAITGRDLPIPLFGPGDYSLAFVGRASQSPVSVGFNVQGFHPWAVLDNYYVAPQGSVGFTGHDFVPGEVVQVYLNTTLSQPVAQVTADQDGHFSVNNAFTLPPLSGNNQVIFVGQQSQTEVTATFAAAAPTPSTLD